MGHPVAFFSKALSVNNQRLSTYEKEFLAVLTAVDKWRSYLQRNQFIIKTDHKSLCHLQDQNLSTDLQRKAMAKLAELQFKFQYKKGPNKVADALSKVGHFLSLTYVSSVVPVWIQEVVNSYVVDEQAQALLQELAVVSPNAQGYTLQDGLIRPKKKIWVGANSALRTKIISAFHSSTMGDHSGIQATYQRVSKLFTWKGLKQEVESFVKQCVVCQHAKHVKSPGLLSPLPIPEGAWQDISMDFIEGLQKSQGYSVIFVVVDRFTNYAHFVPLKHPYTVASV